MNKSTETLLWVAGGVGLLYLLSRQSSASACPALLNAGGNTYNTAAAACPQSYIECGIAPTVSSILAQF